MLTGDVDIEMIESSPGARVNETVYAKGVGLICPQSSQNVIINLYIMTGIGCCNK